MKQLQDKRLSPGRAGIAATTLTAAMCLTLSACASSDTEKTDKLIYATGRPVYKAGEPDEDKVVAVIWDQGEYGFVHVERAETLASPNDHPVRLKPEEIEAVLEELEVRQGKGKGKPVFEEHDLDTFSERIVEALAQAGPAEDVTFAIASRGRFALFSPRLVNTGRMFYKDGRLNVIFGLVQENFDSQLRATGILRPFTAGSRSGRVQQGWSIEPGASSRYADAGRQDWIQTRIQTDVAARGATPADASVTHLGGASPGGTPQVSPPLAQPGASPLGSPVPVYDQNNPYYQEVENQLMGLLRLRRLDLITEEEYQRKRGQLINRL